MQQEQGNVDSGYPELIARLIENIKLESYKLMELEEGSRALDVGCGTGTDTLRLASFTGPSGIVIGIDRDPRMVEEANRAAEAAGVNSWVEHAEGDAAALPFGEGIFSASRSDRLFQHLADPLPARVLAEMVRVTESGGRVVVLDTDYASGSVATHEIETERRLARVMAERQVSNGYVARSLPRLFTDAGLVDIDVDVFPIMIRSYGAYRQINRLDLIERAALDAGIITAEGLDRWHRSLEEAELKGTFLAHGNMVLVAGRKL
jgi:ubiquinone/menaquinone biosynthesis C-methylase UbiE